MQFGTVPYCAWQYHIVPVKEQGNLVKWEIHEMSAVEAFVKAGQTLTKCRRNPGMQVWNAKEGRWNVRQHFMVGLWNLMKFSQKILRRSQIFGSPQQYSQNSMQVGSLCQCFVKKVWKEYSQYGNHHWHTCIIKLHWQGLECWLSSDWLGQEIDFNIERAFRPLKLSQKFEIPQNTVKYLRALKCFSEF